MKKGTRFGIQNGLTIGPKSNQFWGPFWDLFQDHFGRVWGPLLGIHFGSRWTQKEPRGAQKGPLELQEAKKEHLEKV